MPKFTGSTDETHVFTLPSEIDAVRFDRRQAAPGGEIGLEIRTLFCAEGSRLQVQLLDAQGTVHNTLDGRLAGEDMNLRLRVPQKAKGGLLAKVKMPNHGLSAESEALKVTEPVRVRGARWSQEEVKRGDILTLTADAKGAPDGRRATVRIFEYKERGAHVPVTRLRPRVENGAVEVMYRFQYPGDTSDVVPEWKAPEGYVQPQFFYTVDVSGIQADSQDAKSKGVMRFVDDLTLQVVNAQSGAPYPEQDVELTLADRSTQTKTTNGSGTVELKEIPPGPVKVKLPELGGAADEPGEETDNAQHVVADIAPDGPPVATVATGASWRVWVNRAGAPLPTG
ncbi:hypothetical protein BSZ35_04500 [Salinibacter sp. 10B]|uniref:hypothetical protein n=1 Tax=Salinibacter sp. 10B TaxID=1923971 RepID=UPI000CF40C8E|nr:hypothetical protein [Salinibacter sp. 10B]PQJ33969.1 hypothetical protein BSZ35_04500 [Salinibacter sp. 10B]